MKISKVQGIFLFLILINTLNTTIACIPSRKPQKPVMPPVNPVTPDPYINRTTKNVSFVEISSEYTCNLNAEPDKKLFYCYHNGTCLSKLAPVNLTHYERQVYCRCEKVKSTFDAVNSH